MAVDTWDEIRTAYHVARLGTVSGAAEALGVHHATVIRHVDALEERLGAKLFQRHARGYTATEAGRDLLNVASATEDQFTQLVGRIKGRGSDVTGDLIVTSLPILSRRITPLLAGFQQENPGVTVRFLTETRLFRLEYGEAHVAVRAGTRPDQPDNVVQPFLTEGMGLYATHAYVERHGMLEPGNWGDHVFVGPDDMEHRAPFFRWMVDNIPHEQIKYRASEQRSTEDAIDASAGIGFKQCWDGDADPNLVKMMAPLPDWGSDLWIVTHVDLHRTPKVQALVSYLKSKAKEWAALG